MKGLLGNFGPKVGAISRGKFEARFQELVKDDLMLKTATKPMLRARAALRQELAILEKASSPACSGRSDLSPIDDDAGVGTVVVLTFRAVVDDSARFRSLKRGGLWAGLIPSRNRAGEHDLSGTFAKAGDVNLRRALCRPATVMMNRGRSTWLRIWGAQPARRRGAENSDGRPRSTFCCHPSSNLGARYRTPARRGAEQDLISCYSTHCLPDLRPWKVPQGRGSDDALPVVCSATTAGAAKVKAVADFYQARH